MTTTNDPTAITPFSADDHFFMSEALKEAQKAFDANEVPVGAVVVYDGQIIGRGYNQVITKSDPTCHAEIMAMRDAAAHLENYRLPNCQLYVTLEPCLMCVGAIFNARIQQVIFGANEPKTGASGSIIDAFSLSKLNFHATVTGGLMADTCANMLSDFFSLRRKNKCRVIMIKRLLVSVAQQTLTLFDPEERIEKVYHISTATNGVGEQKGSEQTPRGLHKIRAKIGTNQPKNTVFVARRSTGETYIPALGDQYTDRDWILTRILWLSGLEIGKNRFGNVDTMARYIYIHGVPDDADLSTPRSKGCINMTNDDIVDLFDRVNVNDRVLITEI